MGFNIRVRNEKPFHVVGMGLNSVDFLCLVPQYPASNSKVRMVDFSKQGGGQVATAMVALSRWGVKTKYLGKVGSDEFGHLALDSIRQEGVDVSSVIVEPQATNQFAFIIVEGLHGDRTILWNRDERLMYRDGELRRDEVCSGSLLHLDGHDIRAAIQAAHWAREEKIPTVLDVDQVEPLTSELIKEIDFLITSSRFPTLFTGIEDRGKALLELQRHTPGFVCATLGPEGAIALVEGDLFHAVGFDVEAVDTTGAGDVFHGGFIYGLLQNWKLEEILRFANAVAALKCLHLGGRKGIPSLEEATRWLGSSFVLRHLQEE